MVKVILASLFMILLILHALTAALEDGKEVNYTKRHRLAYIFFIAVGLNVYRPNFLTTVLTIVALIISTIEFQKFNLLTKVTVVVGVLTVIANQFN